MNMRLLVGVAAVALSAASGALAQSATSGWYVAADVGYHDPSGVKTTTTNNLDWTFSGDHDWTGFGRFGYKFSPNFRLEAEYGYRPGDLKSVLSPTANAAQPIGLCAPGVTRSAASPACGKPNGSLKAQTAMANAIFDIAPNSSLNPFIGGGVGVAWVQNKAYGQLSGLPATGGFAPYQNTNFNDTDQAMALQAIAGVAWNFADNWSLDLTGRYLRTSKLNWGSVTQNAGPGVGNIYDVGYASGRYKDASVTLGLRYTFGSAPPPPPPAPAYEAREFVVYFPFDQYILTPEAQAVVQQAADYAKGGNASKIVVVGHTDTSGSDKYNQKLSERRAKAVADGLVSLGVPATTLSVDWKGEKDLAVPTKDGVKEPLNRRSTVSITF
ncbi:OmpA family protein [Caulobacter sp. SSI4214]|uniref:OmpA family protein n=1 Tax=Caulobacter sp. SSI4214 TaxID=2575739 RepID=UPI00143945FE|nr:OmpA family protein [Caulobacter sp. SSI4214]